ncbi:MAG: hypothetical protein ABIJ97_15445 [Bacteroidota bacterium]
MIKVLTYTFFFSLIFFSCKKFQNDDPSFHLTSVRNRIVGKWIFEKSIDTYTLDFRKDNIVVVYTDNKTIETIWELSFDKQKFYLRLFDDMQNEIIDSDFYIITRLDNQEMWLSEPGNSYSVFIFKKS